MALRNATNAFFSICRMRSAEISYFPASAFNVSFGSVNQRRVTMSRLRSSRSASAAKSCSLFVSAISTDSSCCDGSKRKSEKYATGATCSSSSAGFASKARSRALRRSSICNTSFGSTFRSLATAATSSLFSQPRRFFERRKLKNNFRCDLVVATLTIRQLRIMNSCISARTQ